MTKVAIINVNFASGWPHTFTLNFTGLILFRINSYHVATSTTVKNVFVLVQSLTMLHFMSKDNHVCVIGASSKLIG